MKINLTKEQVKNIAFWVLIAVGVGFCVGGIFVPPLIGAGVAVLSGAIAIAKDTGLVSQENPTEDPIDLPSETDSPVSSEGDNIKLDFHVDLGHHHRSRSRQAPKPVENEPQVESKRDCDHGPVPRHKPRP